MARNDHKRVNLFNQFASNLDLLKEHPSVTVEPDAANTFLCPLCWKLYSIEAISHLTLEHVPPDYFGGRVRILTCQICNNTSGHLLDSHLARKEELDNALATSSPVEATFTVNKSFKIKGALQVSKPGHVSVYLNKSSNPYRFPELIQLLEQGSTPEVKYHIKGYNKKHVQIALLRIAYLIAVSELGYGFLCNDRIHEVRLQIQHPLQDIMPSSGIIPGNYPDEVLGINYVSYPSEEDAFLVVFDLRSQGVPFDMVYSFQEQTS